MTVLLDTNVVVDVLRGNALAIAFVQRLTVRPSISVVTVTELFAGARSRREESHIDMVLDAATVLLVTREIGRAAGQAIKRYQSSHGMDDFDAVIAATAEHHGLELATRNVKRFPMLPKLKPAY